MYRKATRQTISLFMYATHEIHLFRSIPLSHCMPSLQPNKQLQLILSHLLCIQFSLQRYWQFSPYDSEHSEMF